MLDALLDGLARLLFAAACPGCLEGGFGGRLCDECWGRLPRLEDAGCEVCAEPLPLGGAGLAGRTVRCGECLDGRPFGRLRVVAAYDGPWRELLQGVKYRGRRSLGYDIGVRAGRLLAPEIAGFELIVPVPLGRARRRQRGYDQAEVLAEGIARGLDAPPPRRAVSRCRETAPQTSLGRPGRRRNLRGAFRASGLVHGRSVLLVDDVVTTGATLDAAARAVRRAGAVEVCAVAVARATFRTALAEDAPAVAHS